MYVHPGQKYFFLYLHNPLILYFFVHLIFFMYLPTRISPLFFLPLARLTQPHLN